MNLSTNLRSRCNSACEWCSSTTEPLQPYLVPTRTEEKDENAVVLCPTCFDHIQKQDFADADYFYFLTGSIWSDVPAVKVLSYKVLSKLTNNEWAKDALDNAFLTESEQAWADSEDEARTDQVIHKDAYGMVLESGDTVFLIESLPVKGANFTAAKGTKVPKIRLVPDNAAQIEGKIEGMTIVILTKYVRKSS